MSHPRELLSAFLDGELGPEERLRVEQHVAACPACADELGELALVDEWARDEQVVAPEGYFESLPGRVRTRLRASAARVRPRRLVPQWAWAAAALVLVGLLIPITFLRREQAPMASAPYSPAGGAKDAPALEVVPTSAPLEAAPELSKQVPPLYDRPAPAPAAPEPKRPAAIPEGFSAAPPPRTAPPTQTRDGADEADDRKTLGYADEAKPDDEEEARRSRGAGALAESRLEAREQRAPEAPGVAAPAPGAAAPPPATITSAPVGGLTGAEGERKLGRSQDRDARADAYRQPSPSAKRKAEEPAQAAAEDAYVMLLAAPLPQSANDARALRQAWRGFAEAHPEDPRADEARVRSLEAALLAFRLSGESRDRATLEQDVAAYAKRPDARQARRARALLPR